MSLTNPNDIVTEERLAQFYGEILPYMGGMPDALFNKFDKADMYSETEKVVGCWTNGKPIYQKSFTFTNVSKSSADEQINIGDISGYNIDEGWVSDLYVVSHNYEYGLGFCQAWIRLPYNNFGFKTDEPQAQTYDKVVITARYTKTTDSANSFNYSDGNDYSTDEQIVGKWIDGKPIYQKTFTGTKVSGTNWETNVTDLSIDKIVFINGLLDGNNSNMYPIPTYQSSSYYIFAFYYKVGKTLLIMSSDESYYNGSFSLTIRYTKTTD